MLCSSSAGRLVQYSCESLFGCLRTLFRCDLRVLSIVWEGVVLRAPFVNALRRYWLAVFILTSLAYVVIYMSHEAVRLHRAPRFYGAAFVATALVHSLFWVLASALWQRLVHHSAHRAIGLFESFSQICMVNLGKYLPGKIWGMVARGSRLRARHDVSVEHVVRATVFEQFFLLYAAGIVVLLCGLPIFTTTWTWLAMMLAGLAVAMVTPASRLMLRIVGWLSSRFVRFQGARPSLMRLGQWDYYLYLLGYLGIWLLLGSVLCGLMIAFFPLHLSLSLFLVAVVAATVGYVAGFLAVFAPGGVGVREAVGSAVLVTAMPVSDALLVSFIFRLWMVGMEGLAGVTVLLLSRRIGLIESGK